MVSVCGGDVALTQWYVGAWTAARRSEEGRSDGIL